MNVIAHVNSDPSPEELDKIGELTTAIDAFVAHDLFQGMNPMRDGGESLIWDWYLLSLEGPKLPKTTVIAPVSKDNTYYDFYGTDYEIEKEEAAWMLSSYYLSHLLMFHYEWDAVKEKLHPINRACVGYGIKWVNDTGYDRVARFMDYAKEQLRNPNSFKVLD